MVRNGLGHLLAKDFFRVPACLECLDYGRSRTAYLALILFTDPQLWAGFFHFQRMLSHRYYGARHPTVIYFRPVGKVVLCLFVHRPRPDDRGIFRLAPYVLYTLHSILTNGFRNPFIDFHLV